MWKLLILNLILIFLIALGCFFCKKYAKSKRARKLILIFSSLGVIIFHYSSFLFKLLFGSGAIEYLSGNPNLILPIYPCNLVMWCTFIFSLMKKKKGKFGAFLTDYIFWFGIVSTLVGMFLNVDFLVNPTLRDYEIVKSIVAHAMLLFFVLLLKIFGYVKVDLWRNMKNILASILMMLIVGAYCNLLFLVLVSSEAAYDVNSMFLIHSPFEGAPFLKYPVISLIAIPIYFAVFWVCELAVYRKGNRFYNRFVDWFVNKFG